MQNQSGNQPAEGRNDPALPTGQALENDQDVARSAQGDPLQQLRASPISPVGEPSDQADAAREHQVKRLLTEAEAFANQQRSLPMPTEESSCGGTDAPPGRC